jgi:hypothetical protein
LAFVIYTPKPRHHESFWTNKILNHINTPVPRLSEINPENSRQLHPSPLPIIPNQFAFAFNFVADPIKDHIPHFKKIIPRFFTIRPQVLPGFPFRVAWVMDLAAAVVAVTVIIPLDVDLFEFILQQLNVAFEEFLEIRFYT